MSAQLNYPNSLATDVSGNIYVADTLNLRVRKITPSGVITTVAGSGDTLRDGGPATSSSIYPTAVAVDSAGNLYIAEEPSRIRKVSSSGIISTIGGNGRSGYSGDGGPATSASFFSPHGIAVDTSGNVFVADTQNHRIRKISSSGTVVTVAGSGGSGNTGDGGAATNAQIGFPFSVVVDRNGNLYIGVGSGVRKVNTQGIITTVIPTVCPSGCLSSSQVAVGPDESIYFSTFREVRRLSPTGVLSQITGNGTGYSGDGGPASNATFGLLSGIAVTSAGSVYVADSFWGAIRLLQPGPPFAVNAVTNAASNRSGAIAPGQIVIIAGSALGPAQIATATVGSGDGRYPMQVAGTSVQINGEVAPMIYSWANQVAAIVPYSIAGSNARITVTYQGQTTTEFSVPVALSSPGVFTLDSTGQGQAACVNREGSLNTAATPARIGEVISCFATGEGRTTPAGIDGRPVAIPLPQPILPVSVSVGGQRVRPQYAGGAPGQLAGLMQVNFEIPTGIQTGNAVPFVLTVGDVSSQVGVTISVR